VLEYVFDFCEVLCPIADLSGASRKKKIGIGGWDLNHRFGFCLI
jgi:hypothetical protein